MLTASRALVAVAARSLAVAAPADVTLPQYRALVVLAARGPTRVGDLADALGIHPSTATRLCDRLVDRRLVRRAVDRTNRRETDDLVVGGGTQGRRRRHRGAAGRDPGDRRSDPGRPAGARRRCAGGLRRGGGRAAPGGMDVGLVMSVVGPMRSRVRRVGVGTPRPPDRVVVLAGGVGAVTGLAVAGFDRLVVDVMFDHIDELPSWLLAILPGVGLLVALAARQVIGGGASPATADEYLRAFHQPGERLGWRAFAGRIVAAVATLGLGRARWASKDRRCTSGPRRQQRAAAGRRTLGRHRPAHVDRRRRGSRCRRDLQGAGHRRGLRARGPVPR